MVDRQDQVANESQLASGGALFPMQLTPFEKFLIWDERPQHPMNSFIELHFDSQLDTSLLEDALTAAVHRNPLLACRIVQREDELYWQYVPGYRPKLRLESQNPPLTGGWPIPINLWTECGSRYWYREQEGGSRLLIQLHHACTDGVGLRRVLIDALTGYARAIEKRNQRGLGTNGNRLATFEKLDTESLQDRFDFSKSFTGPPMRNLTTWERIKNAHYFHFQLPKPLIGKDDIEFNLPEVRGGEPLMHSILERNVSKQIQDKCRTQGYGINDLALALLFQACAHWNKRRGDPKPNSRIRLLMPYDLRSRVDLRMPATNRLSFSFLGRTYSQCEDLDKLIRSVHQEVKSVKETRLALDFLEAISRMSARPRVMQWLLKKSNRMSTAVLTYTGDVSRGMKRYFPERDGVRLIGNAGLRNILVAPPVRRNTNISLGLCVNWGQLCISAAWNREVFTAADCQEFLELYRQGWMDWADK